MENYLNFDKPIRYISENFEKMIQEETRQKMKWSMMDDHMKIEEIPAQETEVTFTTIYNKLKEYRKKIPTCQELVKVRLRLYPNKKFLDLTFLGRSYFYTLIREVDEVWRQDQFSRSKLLHTDVKHIGRILPHIEPIPRKIGKEIVYRICVHRLFLRWYLLFSSTIADRRRPIEVQPVRSL